MITMLSFEDVSNSKGKACRLEISSLKANEWAHRISYSIPCRLSTLWVHALADRYMYDDTNWKIKPLETAVHVHTYMYMYM